MHKHDWVIERKTTNDRDIYFVLRCACGAEVIRMPRRGR